MSGGMGLIIVTPDPFCDLPDDPSAHRWRATWESSSFDGPIDSIALAAYPVVRETACGAWIDHHATFIGGPRGWLLSGLRRWVANGSRSAFAKPTREQALQSLRVRLRRWLERERADLQRAMDAATLAAKTWPEDRRKIDELVGYIRETIP